ncbi:MAG TPA: 50S ribosomal protein L11 methyltransferase [Chthoniobacterales bacterium]|jgi:ribosomal protein L11 methyltransferase|nr:50S ribosomal protein L11 methyltransferase [Chthoniobacterales bacterium]
MYLWRKSASQRWLSDNEERLGAIGGDRLAIIERANQKRFQIEIASKSRVRLEPIAKKFGGRIQKLPRAWLKRALRRKTKPIKVGSKSLAIPAGAAFGTGEHATTMMSLLLLEKVSRELKRGWSIVDLGTGSGILALAAKILGAQRVFGIDNDPVAIRTAKQNARLNKIRLVQFRVGDVRNWKLPPKIDIVTANLFSELLIEISPKLKAARWIILSGFLREQEPEVTRALTRNKIDIVRACRRGKWVAILAAGSGGL